MSITVAPLTTTVMSSVPTEAAGVASGVNNAVSRVAALLAIALLGIVMTQVFDHALDRKLSTLALPAGAAHAVEIEREKLAAIQIPPEIEPATRKTLEQAIAASFVGGFRAVMLLAALAAFASAGLAFATIDRESSRSG